MNFPATHEVFNQVPDLEPYRAADDPALLEGLRREGASWAEDEVRELGALAGTARAQDWGRSPTSTRPCCTPTTATATASTRSSSIRTGTT